MKLTTVRMEHSNCFWNNLFNDEELSAIIEYCESIPKVDAKVGTDNSDDGQLNENIRYSKIAWIYRNEDTDWFFSRIESASNKLNSKFFGFDIETLTTLQYTVYDGESSHYDWHWDCFTGNNLDNLNDQKQRKLTSVLQLDDPDDYTGGFLELLPCGMAERMERKKGFMVTFPSFLVHRVTPVETGLRRSLVAWFTGPDWR